MNRRKLDGATLPDVLVVADWARLLPAPTGEAPGGVDREELLTALGDRLRARRSRASGLEEAAIEPLVEIREQAEDQVDEARTVVMVWSRETAAVARKNLETALEPVLEEMATTDATRVRDLVSRAFSFPRPSDEVVRARNGDAAPILELVRDPYVAPLLASETFRARLAPLTVAALIAARRERLVWLKVENEAVYDSGTASSLASKILSSVRSRPTWKARQLDEAVAAIAAILERPMTFEEVLREELLLLAKSGKSAHRSRRENVFARAHESQLVGLAFSGGGIRSATFNLGVLQALAKFGLLRSFHYLSTVSGGGYIGSWFSAWMHNKSREEVERGLRSELPIHLKDEEAPLEREWSPITWLRRFSNYLTPRTGIFSLDTWTAIVTYLRNLVLNLAIVALALVAVLLVPKLFAQLYFWIGHPLEAPHRVASWLPWIAAASALVSLRFTIAELGRNSEGSRSSGKGAGAQGASPRKVMLVVVLPLFVAAIAMALWLPSLGPSFGALPRLGWTAGPYTLWMLLGGLAHLGLWSIGVAIGVKWWAGERRGNWKRVLGWSFVAGAAGGAALCWLSLRFHARWIDVPFFGPPGFIAPFVDSVGWMEVLVWGAPAVMLAFLLTAVLHIGLVGRARTESYRQWWSRLGAWQLILGVVWAGLFSLVFYGPPFLEDVSARVRGSLSLTWIGATAAGLLAGRSPVTGDRGNRRLIEATALVAPYVFMIGLITALALAVDRLSSAIISRLDGSHESARSLTEIADHPEIFLGMAALSIALAAVLSWRVDVNEFSMHNFYRNRLIRAYLGASRERRPIRFTGFDREDDLRLYRIAKGKADASGAGADRTRELQTPIQILNTTLSVTTGEELAWQERKASSFFFTPFHFGFDPGRLGADLAETGYRRTPDDDRFTLGTTLAISGAAVNPNMGYHSSTALAFLMTVFNSRLGWWLRNPKRDNWAKPGPRLGLMPLLNELRGVAGARSAYVNLADGGFFDNLGIYELVRRRCRFILACDAEADAGYEFNGLGNAIRRCRSDFGVDIRIQLDPIRKNPDTGFSRWHCAVGTICYGEADEKAPDGVLVYLKASLTGDEPEDLLNYASRRKGFPHESTADQWFGEAQFESYRMLGYHEALEMLSTAGERELTDAELEDPSLIEDRNIENVIGALKRTWYPPTAAAAGSFTRHTEKLVRIFDQLRDKDGYAFLDKGLYLEVDDWIHQRADESSGGAQLEEGENHPAALPVGESATAVPSLPSPPVGEDRDPKEIRASFYLCSSMIQLMENVYLDLDLEDEWDHPDNRGWMNLFRHWASFKRFRQTWAVSAATYGARFQTFCYRRLNLSLGSVWVEQVEVGKAPLSSIEQTLIGELDGLGEEGSFDRFYMLKMSVLRPEALARHRRRNKFDAITRGKRKEIEGDVIMDIPIGIAAISDEALGEPAGEDVSQRGRKNLRLFRVRNHLRQLGLGRQALRRLIVDHEVRGTRLIRAPSSALGVETGLKNLFRSVLNEYYRWKDSLLAEVYAETAGLEGPSVDEVEKKIAEIVGGIEKRWGVSEDTVRTILNTDLQARKSWLVRTGRFGKLSKSFLDRAAVERRQDPESFRRLVFALDRRWDSENGA